MIRSVTFEKTLYNQLPSKFEAGTPDIAGAIGLGAVVGEPLGGDLFTLHSGGCHEIHLGDSVHVHCGPLGRRLSRWRSGWLCTRTLRWRL